MKHIELPFYCVAYSKKLDLRISVGDKLGYKHYEPQMPNIDENENQWYVKDKLIESLSSTDDWEVIYVADEIKEIVSSINELEELNECWKDVSKKFYLLFDQYDEEKKRITEKYFKKHSILYSSGFGHIDFCGMIIINTVPIELHINNLKTAQQFQQFKNWDLSEIEINSVTIKFLTSGTCYICSQEIKTGISLDTTGREYSGKEFCKECIKILNDKLQAV